MQSFIFDIQKMNVNVRSIHFDLIAHRPKSRKIETFRKNTRLNYGKYARQNLSRKRDTDATSKRGCFSDYGTSNHSPTDSFERISYMFTTESTAGRKNVWRKKKGTYLRLLLRLLCARLLLCAHMCVVLWWNCLLIFSWMSGGLLLKSMNHQPLRLSHMICNVNNANGTRLMCPMDWLYQKLLVPFTKTSYLKYKTHILIRYDFWYLFCYWFYLHAFNPFHWLQVIATATSFMLQVTECIMQLPINCSLSIHSGR